MSESDDHSSAPSALPSQLHSTDEPSSVPTIVAEFSSSSPTSDDSSMSLVPSEQYSEDEADAIEAAEITQEEYDMALEELRQEIQEVPSSEILSFPEQGEEIEAFDSETILALLNDLEKEFEANRVLSPDTKNSITGLKDKVKKDPDFLKDNGKQIVGLTKGIAGFIPILKEGDNKKIILGGMKLVGAVSKFLPSPANFLTDMGLSILGGIISLSDEKSPSESDKLKSVIDASLFEVVKSTYNGEKKLLDTAFSELQAWNSWSNEALMKEKVHKALHQGRFAQAGLKILGKFHTFITDAWDSKDKATLDKAVYSLYAYCYASTMRIQVKQRIAALYKRMGMPNSAQKSLNEANDVLRDSKADLRRLMAAPNPNKADYHELYTALYLRLDAYQMSVVELYMEDSLGSTAFGTMVRIKSRDQYMVTDHQAISRLIGVPRGSRVNMVETVEQKDYQGQRHSQPNWSSFVVIGSAHDFSIFSLHSKDYVRMARASQPWYWAYGEQFRILKNWWKCTTNDCRLNAMPLQHHIGDFKHNQDPSAYVVDLYFEPDAYKFQVHYTAHGMHIFNKLYAWNIFSTTWESTCDKRSGSGRNCVTAHNGGRIARRNVMAYKTAGVAVPQGTWSFESLDGHHMDPKIVFNK
ncbi:MAG: hypothetical protein SGILL_003116 [Bacillariaceae sp.]